MGAPEKDSARPATTAPVGQATAPVGQAEERARIASLLAAARAGQSGVLVLRGEPGIGKTTVLRQVAADAAGMTVVTTRGSASESATPLCALADLLRPVQPAWDRLEQPWRDLIAGALTLDPDAPAVKRRASLRTATLLALAAAAEQTPLVLVVDDAQWLDDASAAALHFVLRRLDAEPIAVLVASRTGEPSFVDGAGFDEIALGGLGPEDVSEILAAHGMPVAPRAASAISRATGGNPLASIECARLLDPGQRRGIEPLPDPLPIGREIDREFARQVRALPASCSLALLLLAADEEARLAEAVQAMAVLGLAVDDLAEAERLGLIELTGELARWRHPLVRLAAYHVATSPDRRRAHRALSTVVSDPFRRAHHIGAAAVGLDEDAASALDAAAETARSLDLPEIAMELWRRSAELSASPHDRCGRLTSAALAASEAGRLSAGENLASLAAALADTPAQHARLVQLRCRSVWALGHVPVHEMLADEADQVSAVAPGVASQLLADAAMNALGCALVDVSVKHADEALALAETVADEPGSLGIIRAIRGQILICAGRAAEGYRLLEENQEAIDADRSLVALFMCFGRIIAEDFDGARERLERFVENARTAGAVEAIGYPLGHLADLDLRTGNWARAYARACEAAQAAELAGQHSILHFGLAWMARIEALTGRDALCAEHCDVVIEATRECDQALYSYALVARADLALGRGQPARAIEAYRELRELQASRGEPDQAITPWLPGLVEALVMLGRRDEAADAFAAGREALQRDERRWPRAVAGRLAGVLEEDDVAREAAFAAALVLHDELPMPFERARTQLALGTARRRAGQRRAAREPLAAAHRAFVALGAEPWVERAARELSATGERVRAGLSPTQVQLSPQELSVATLVAEGRTNLEVAAALFLSPKTVEAHLSRAFRKLGVTNRSQLGRIVRERYGDDVTARSSE